MGERGSGSSALTDELENPPNPDIHQIWNENNCLKSEVIQLRDEIRFLKEEAKKRQGELDHTRAASLKALQFARTHIHPKADHLADLIGKALMNIEHAKMLIENPEVFSEGATFILDKEPE